MLLYVMRLEGTGTNETADLCFPALAGPPLNTRTAVEKGLARQGGRRKKGKGWRGVFQILYLKKIPSEKHLGCAFLWVRGTAPALGPGTAPREGSSGAVLLPEGNTACGSSCGVFTALSSPSLKKHLKPVVRINFVVLKRERERSKGGSASPGRLWLEGPHSCLGRATVLMVRSSFSSLKRKQSTNQQ